MNFPTAIALHGFGASDALRRDVLERAQGLDRLIDDILACRISIESDSHRRLHHGCRYCVRIQVTLPCTEIEVSGSMTACSPEYDVQRTVAETFGVLALRIDDYVRRRCQACDRHVAAGT
jgi:hypothetical protein